MTPIFGWGKGDAKDGALGVEELSRRVGVSTELLRSVKPHYKVFKIPKRGGGMRTLMAPDRNLKDVQRLVLRGVLGRLRAHPAAMAYERGLSIADNAALHAGRAVVVRMDVVDFFTTTTERRVVDWFRAIGWNKEAAGLLAKLCCHEGGLPQGAPTSPRLSNLVNFRLDARLAAFAAKIGAVYTRYADDLTLSFAADDGKAIRSAINFVRFAAGKEGYKLHSRKKLSVRRAHERQKVTGLVVNGGPPRLPRETRRLLRAAEHRLRVGAPGGMDESQIKGWRALTSMIERAGRRE